MLRFFFFDKLFLTYFSFFLFTGRSSSTADKGVPDMTCISDIDETGINRNLKVRYERDEIYVSFSIIRINYIFFILSLNDERIQ